MVNIGNTIVDIYLRTLCHLPATAVLTAYLLKPKVCQCQPDFGGIDLHIRRKSCRYLRGSHVLRLRFGAGVHEVGDEKFGGRVGSHEVAVVVVKTSDVGVVEPVALAAFDEDTDLSPVPMLIFFVGDRCFCLSPVCHRIKILYINVLGLNGDR